MHIELDDLTRPEVHALLAEHLDDMYAISPADSVHALDLDALRSRDVTFWTVWTGPELLGCGALKELDSTHGEIKSMRTPADKRRRGAGRFVLVHIIEEARRRQYQRLSLETGPPSTFGAAAALYKRFGFVDCGPFASYGEDPHSRFMTLALD